MENYWNNLLELSLEAAPWLVLGFAIGGLMKALIPTAFLRRHLQGKGMGPVLKASFLGAPLPLCSCGVLPAAMGLREAGASKPATISFLVATPETGIDSVSITYALMGPVMAIVRPISALISAITAGLLVSIFAKEESVAPKEAPKTKTCCGGASKKNEQKAPKQSFFARGLGGIKYAFTNLLSKILFWLVIGILFAAAVKTWVPAGFLAQWGTGLPAMLVMLLAGIPMYICATASTPIAAGLMLAGVSPGAALVLLLSGPATNIGSIGIISKELGKKAMWLYLLAVCGIAVLSGLILDKVISTTSWAVDISHDHSAMVDPRLAWASLILLVAASLNIVVKDMKKSRE